MKRRKDVRLKDREHDVIEAMNQSNQEQIDMLVEEYERRLLGKQQESNSIATIPGGRPESNRRKF